MPRNVSKSTVSTKYTLTHLWYDSYLLSHTAWLIPTKYRKWRFWWRKITFRRFVNGLVTWWHENFFELVMNFIYLKVRIRIDSTPSWFLEYAQNNSIMPLYQDIAFFTLEDFQPSFKNSKSRIWVSWFLWNGMDMFLGHGDMLK